MLHSFSLRQQLQTARQGKLEMPDNSFMFDHKSAKNIVIFVGYTCVAFFLIVSFQNYLMLCTSMMLLAE